MTAHNPLITIQSCRIRRNGETAVSAFSWTMRSGQTWLVTGPNGGGKSHFIAALSGGSASFEPDGDGALYANVFGNDTAAVSLETAAALIAEERANDESDYIEGGVDAGRTARRYISEVYTGTVPLETCPETLLCGVQTVLDRGLKYLSTGEIRRVLLCRALLSRKKLLILSDPFAGLDAASRSILRDFFAANADPSAAHTYLSAAHKGHPAPDVAPSAAHKGHPAPDVYPSAAHKRHPASDVYPSAAHKRHPAPDVAPSAAHTYLSAAQQELYKPSIILCMERYCDIPGGISDVIEFTGGSVSYCGESAGYEAVLAFRLFKTASAAASQKSAIAQTVNELKQERVLFADTANDGGLSESAAESAAPAASSARELVKMRNVTVGWDGRAVLDNINWTLYEGEHWLIRGPNGSGKTTLLELITGDNLQVFSNDVSLFGRRRGTGETLWELKEKMGIVSYRLHLEYRMVGGTDLEAVLLSGLHDSIGLYEQRSQVEQMTVRKWLALGGFAGREQVTFNSLSYGEQRAVLILRAAVKCPPLLILDEPCHGLDETNRTMILHLLESVAETGTSTLLHVTHDPDEALSCEKHILELHPGESPMYRIIEQS